MKVKLFILLLAALLGFMCSTPEQTNHQKGNSVPHTVAYSIALHGGAGNIDSTTITAEKKLAYEATLALALDSGLRMLARGDSAIDVVEAVVNILEDSPLFNAGKGAVLTAQGTFELDAAIMDGKNMKAGAVTNLRHIKNPISLARAVMEKSEHVMMSGVGAEQFAGTVGFELVDTNYFFTQERYDGWLKKNADINNKKHGTVGCVVKDTHGNLAAATSTGGMMNKKYGRVGDAPIIGAGTYASNSSCAVSCTGHGEYFMRYTVAHSVAALVQYANLPLQQAADSVIVRTLKPIGGTGGLIAVDASGNISMVFNTSAMFRAAANSEGYRVVGVFGNAGL